VSSEGDNDGEAFERIQQHLERNGELKDEESAAEAEKVSSDSEQGAEQGQGDKEIGKQGDKVSAPESGVGDEPTRNETNESVKSDNERGETPGAQTTGDDAKSPEEQPDGKQGDAESPGGQQTSTKGPSGAGDEQQSKGAPNSKPEMKPGEKRQQAPSPGEQSNEEEPSAGSRGKRESDSQGEQGGDRSGGGEAGTRQPDKPGAGSGGQKAPREGTGSAGQNQSADEGAGESSEQGTGNDSPNAGRDEVADKQTGQPGGETTGRGSKHRDGEGTKPGGESGIEDDAPGSAPGEDDPGRETADSQQVSRDAKRSADGEQASRQGKASANRHATPTGDGGESGTAAAPPPRIEGTVPDGDEANLDYARKQTDLVLEKLAEQLDRKGVDEDLLKQLGWSEDDLRKFVQRWRERKDAAERRDQSGDAAKRELEEALRSLGLRRGPLQQGRVKDDTLRDLREGYRGPVPLEYQERLRAYNQGVSRARQDDE
jgi:hypothetical protein